MRNMRRIFGLLALATRTLQATTVHVDLGTAAGFAILTKDGISTVPDSVITGDVGVSPIAATAMTGFTLTASADSTYSTSAQVR